MESWAEPGNEANVNTTYVLIKIIIIVMLMNMLREWDRDLGNFESQLPEALLLMWFVFLLFYLSLVGSASK